MKKKSGAARALDILLAPALENLPTRALLARLKRLRWCEESREHCDLTDNEIATAEGKILFKDTQEWKSAYRDIKLLLQDREHIDRIGTQ